MSCSRAGCVRVRAGLELSVLRRMVCCSCGCAACHPSLQWRCCYGRRRRTGTLRGQGQARAESWNEGTSQRTHQAASCCTRPAAAAALRRLRPARLASPCPRASFRCRASLALVHVVPSHAPATHQSGARPLQHRQAPAAGTAGRPQGARVRCVFVSACAVQRQGWPQPPLLAVASCGAAEARGTACGGGTLRRSTATAPPRPQAPHLPVCTHWILRTPDL